MTRQTPALPMQSMAVLDEALFEQSVEAERRHARRSRRWLFVFICVMLLPAGYAGARLLGFAGLQRTAATIALAIAVATCGAMIIALVQWITGQFVMSFSRPGGGARGAGTYSKAQALAAAGRLEEASAEFERLRTAGHVDIAALRAEAEIHMTPAGNPRRAEAVLQQIRRTAECTPGEELYATHRLIDLYQGVLAEPGRALVELRRMAERFPETIDGQGALAELRRRRGITPH